MTDDELMEKLKAITGELIEHCDAVIILASVDTDQGTSLYHHRAGSWHAALGMIEHFKVMKIGEKIIEQTNQEE